MQSFLSKVKESSFTLANLKGDIKVAILNQMADKIEQNIQKITTENRKDIEYAKEIGLSSALVDRLLLDENRVKAMAKAIREIASLREPVGRVLDGWALDNGLKVEKVATPIGVIGVIYESRPNVTSDVAALCFKSGNSVLLKGGKEAQNSNEVIANLLKEVLEENSLPKEAISLFPDSSREGVAKVIKEDKFIDLIIPRGGEALIKFVSEGATVPVIKHDKGLCHTYIDSEADIVKALEIMVNAKVQRVGVCNSMETLLIDRAIAEEMLPRVQTLFDKFETELRGCEFTREVIDIKPAIESDWEEEYLDNILSIRVVDGVNGAINHINRYGSKHSEAIVTENYTNAQKFLNQIDASCVYVNASTRFTDGGVFGFGAEVGISTNKLHSRGPMGINDLTTYKYKIYGDGQIRV